MLNLRRSPAHNPRRSVRLWDAARPTASYLVCGPLWGQESLVDAAGGGGVLQMPQYRYSYGMLEMEGVPVLEERCRLEGHVISTGGDGGGGGGAAGGGGAELRQRLRVHDQVWLRAEAVVIR